MAASSCSVGSRRPGGIDWEKIAERICSRPLIGVTAGLLSRIRNEVHHDDSTTDKYYYAQTVSPAGLSPGLSLGLFHPM